MGKTNLLDAIHYLSLVRSHLGTIDRLSVMKGANEANVVGIYFDDEGEEHRISLRIRSDKPKQLSRNGRLYSRLSDYIGGFPIVIISPQDYRIIRGGSADRRRFVDRLLSQLDKKYLHSLVAYDYALLQRNNMLRSDMRDDTLFAVVEEQMAIAGSDIRCRREHFFEAFLPVFNALYYDVSGTDEKVSILYNSHAADKAEIFAENLARRRPEDFLVGSTTYGTHKDDFELLLDDELMRKIGSEGQNKTFLTGLKFAEYRMITEKRGIKPILLLDDLFDKLDESRVERIIKLVSRDYFGQIFITDTNRKYLDDIIEAQGGQYHLFEVEKGAVKVLS